MHRDRRKGTKKRVLNSMPISEALSQACVDHMGERAQGARLLMDRHKT